MAFIRKIKKKSGTYLAKVESYREGGKVKQRVLEYIGKAEDYDMEGNPKIFGNIEIEKVRKYGDYQVLHQISEKLGLVKLFSSDGSNDSHELCYILLLIYTQLVERQALYKLPSYVDLSCLGEILGFSEISTRQLYEAIDRLEKMNFEEVEQIIVKNIENQFPQLDLKQGLILDVTDTYFKGKNAIWKSRKGKDGKREKLVQIALAITQQGGFPLKQKTYEGNINNIKIFEDLMLDLKALGYDTLILDRGLNSAKILKELQLISQQVITGLKFTAGFRKYVDEIKREDIFQPQNMVMLTKITVFVKQVSYQEGSLLIIYNPEQETALRIKAMQDAEKYDKETIKYKGYSLIYHSTNLDARAVVKTYFDKDTVEKAFKNIKDVIGINPLRKHRIDRINAHVKICYMAYAILAYMEQKLKPLNISASRALELMQGLYSVTIHDKKTKQSFDKTVIIKNTQSKILDALECSV